MRSDFNGIGGRIGVIAAIVLALAALVLYLYSERAVPPETESELPPKADSGTTQEPSSPPEPVASGEQAADVASETGAEAGADVLAEREAAPEAVPEPEISLDRQQQQLREDLALRLGPGQLEMIVEERLIQRLVATVNSLDGAPVPLRFRPLAHVPGLPRVERDGDEIKLPAMSDPRYLAYRALFDRMDVVEIIELFDRYEPAIEKAWQALGEHAGQTFRQRTIEIVDHLVEFELPADRPALHRPKVLYEYLDPSLEQISWGRKILVRLGPEHAPPVQQKLASIAQGLAERTR